MRATQTVDRLHVQKGGRTKMDTKEFFTEYGEANRYTIKEVIGKGSYGVVCSATDTKTGEKVAIKKINNVFDHVSDATRILREIKLLRLLRHPGKPCTALHHRDCSLLQVGGESNGLLDADVH